MLLRSPGRYTYLAVIALLVALAEPVDRRRLFVARAMALLGTAEAVFGLAAFFLPLGGIGLEPTRKFSVLYFEVPGRIAGTLGISPELPRCDLRADHRPDRRPGDRRGRRGVSGWRCGPRSWSRPSP